MRTESLHFIVHGPFITDLARSAYWFEDLRDWAKDLLRTLYSSEGPLDEVRIAALLEGRIKLVGDSDTGVTIEADDGSFREEILEAWTQLETWWVKRSALDAYIDHVARYRRSMLSLAYLNPITGLKMEEERRRLHDLVAESAGFKEREGEDYDAFALALGEYLDDIVAPLGA